MSRQLPIGESSYIPPSRKYHGKFILIGGFFDKQIITLSRCAFNTTVFNIYGEVGRYVGVTRRSLSNSQYQAAIVIDETINYQEYGSIIPALFWEPVSCK